MRSADRGRRGSAASAGPASPFRSFGSSIKESAPSASSASTDSSSRRSRRDKATITNPGLIPPRVCLASASPSPTQSPSPPPSLSPPSAPAQVRMSSRGPQTADVSQSPHRRRRRSSSSKSNLPLRVSAAATIESSGDKDARIVSLERELAAMEAEHVREIDELSTTESESASFWRAKHAALNQQFLRMDTELRDLRSEMTRARRDNGDGITCRDGGSGTSVGSDIHIIGTAIAAPAIAAPAKAWQNDTIRRELAQKDDEIHQLRAQVRGLKEWVSTSTRADGTAATSDEVFGEGWAKLGNGLQNWVISNYRRVRIIDDLASVEDTAARRELDELVPMYEELARTAAKVHLLQSIAAAILVQRVFGAYFVGLSAAQEGQLRHTEKLMASFGSDESLNQWRSLTLSILKKEAAERMQTQTVQTVDETVKYINRILGVITTNTTVQTVTTNSAAKTINGPAAAPDSETRDQALRQLVSNAIELSRLLVVQKAVLEVFMPRILPHRQTLFDQATMEDVGGEDEDEGQLVKREICCVTFPGIIKRGDENGTQLQFRNVISRARVLCSPE